MSVYFILCGYFYYSLSALLKIHLMNYQKELHLLDHLIVNIIFEIIKLKYFIFIYGYFSPGEVVTCYV